LELPVRQPGKAAGQWLDKCLLRVAEDDDVGVIGVDDDGDVRTAPLGVVSGAVVGVVTVSSAR